MGGRHETYTILLLPREIDGLLSCIFQDLPAAATPPRRRYRAGARDSTGENGTMTFVRDFEPKALWGHFNEILTIPRGSREEDQIRAYVLAVAERCGLPHQVDGIGNVVVRKPGTPGREQAPGTILQSHLDMVNEKNSDVVFDFSTDAIRPVLEGGYLTADGTTLGSDNGIGVAAMLAIMEADDLVHGPLEFLFTIDEETGLTGAADLDPSLLSARRLVNLDSEEEGALTVGCAGGAHTELDFALEASSTPGNTTAHRVTLLGLNGGHSGVDIHLQRGNAVQLLARMLHAVSLVTPISVSGIEGGNKHNAIPREATAVVVMPQGRADDLHRGLQQQVEALKAEYRVTEPGLSLKVEDVPVPAAVWSEASTRKVLRILVGLPHGVMAMSNDIPGLVESSTNLASAKGSAEGAAGGSLHVLMSTRSSVASAMVWVRDKIRAVATLAGGEVVEHDGYPGWKPDLDSALLKVVQGVHTRVMGSDARVEAIHAGLECGIIGKMIPGMDMISFGPQIEFPHSPNERVKVDSVGRFWGLLTETLEELSR
jgi:dipeptidase D